MVANISEHFPPQPSLKQHTPRKMHICCELLRFQNQTQKYINATRCRNGEWTLWISMYASFLHCFQTNLHSITVEQAVIILWSEMYWDTKYSITFVTVWTERSQVRTKTTDGQYSSVRLKLARLVSGLLHGNLAKPRPGKCQSERSDLPQDYLAI